MPIIDQELEPKKTSGSKLKSIIPNFKLELSVPEKILPLKSIKSIMDKKDLDFVDKKKMAVNS